MGEFFISNLGTIAAALVILGIVLAIVIGLIRDRRKGKCCGCDSGGACPRCGH
jgi:hypothetical protein